MALSVWATVQNTGSALIGSSQIARGHGFGVWHTPWEAEPPLRLVFWDTGQSRSSWPSLRTSSAAFPPEVVDASFDKIFLIRLNGVLDSLRYINRIHSIGGLWRCAEISKMFRCSCLNAIIVKNLMIMNLITTGACQTLKGRHPLCGHQSLTTFHKTWPLSLRAKVYQNKCEVLKEVMSIGGDKRCSNRRFLQVRAITCDSCRFLHLTFIFSLCFLDDEWLET